MWGAIETAYHWVHSLAHLLANEDQASATQVQRRVIGLLGAMKRWQDHSGSLTTAIDHFFKVTRSYWSGLFHCYAIPDLPRTNNDLEHLFGQHRYLERRITGRKVASSALVMRGSVRMIAAVMTRLQTFSAEQLVLQSIHDWQTLRTELDAAQHKRTLQRRFRQNPDAYLDDLEHRFNQLILPP